MTIKQVAAMHRKSYTLRTSSISLLLIGLLMLSACTDNTDSAGYTMPEYTPRTVESIIGADSGGPLLPEQAAYDVQHYDLDLNIDPDNKYLSGTVTVTADILTPISQFVLDLDTTFTVSSVQLIGQDRKQDLSFKHIPFKKMPPAQALLGSAPQNSRLWIALDREYQTSEKLSVAITYAGQPREVPAGPYTYDGGFIWSTSQSGEHWIGVACAGIGPDVWWPVKDHPSDEPDEGVSLHFTVPNTLAVVTNGKLIKRTDNADGTATHHWRVSTPINHYNVTFNAGPFKEIRQDYRSITGYTFPVSFWVLPEHYDEGKTLYPQITQTLSFFENLLGPYPFQGEKLAIVDTPYYAMEHQTVISYGRLGRRPNPDPINIKGSDFLLFHEMGHEWWGNLATVSDFSDIWLHETTDMYMYALFLERRYGQLAYHEEVARNLEMLDVYSGKTAASRTPTTMKIAYPFVQESQYSSGKAYGLLHTLRYLIGDKHFFQLLRQWMYPSTPTLEGVLSCQQCRNADSAEFIALAEQTSGQELNWFFDLYLYSPELPVLQITESDDRLVLEWQVPEGLRFPMPIEIEQNGKRRRVDMLEGVIEIEKGAGDTINIDPDFWVVRER